MDLGQIEVRLGEVLREKTHRTRISQKKRQQQFDSLVQRLGRYFVAFDRRYLLNCATGFNGKKITPSQNVRIGRLLKNSPQLKAQYLNTKTVWANKDYFIKQVS